MSDDIEKQSIVTKTANKIANVHTSNPLPSILLAALAELIPLIGIGKEVIDQAVTRIQQERFQVLIDELNAGEKLLTDEVVQSEEFIHSFVVIYRAAMNTYQHEKIRCFGRLLLSATEYNELASDTFEEFVDILDAVSAREIAILRMLKQFEDKHRHEFTDPTKPVPESRVN